MASQCMEYLREFPYSQYATSAQKAVPSPGFLKVALGSAVVGVAAFMIGDYFYTSVPDGLYPEDRWRIRKIYARNQWHGVLAKVGSKFGFGKPLEITRRLRDKCSSRLKCNPDIYSENLHFDGVAVVLYRNHRWEASSGSEFSAKNLRPAVIHIYGGGWAFCTSRTYEAHHRFLADKLNVAVLTIDYKKAPENPFPGPLAECFAAIRHFFENAEDYGVDAARISLIGDSAGANICAGLLLKLQDEHLGFLIKNAVLMYPPTQFMNFRTRSYLGQFPLLGQEVMIKSIILYTKEKMTLVPGLMNNAHTGSDFLNMFDAPWMALRKYVPEVPPSGQPTSPAFESFCKKAANPYLCPLMRESLKDFPPTFLLTCEFDVLRDDGMAFADRLESDHVAVKREEFPGTHGTFRYFEELRVGKEMMEAVIRYLRKNIFMDQAE